LFRQPPLTSVHNHAVHPAAKLEIYESQCFTMFFYKFTMHSHTPTTLGRLTLNITVVSRAWVPDINSGPLRASFSRYSSSVENRSLARTRYLVRMAQHSVTP
jgi:hypothetical protein